VPISLPTKDGGICWTVRSEGSPVYSLILALIDGVDSSKKLPTSRPVTCAKTFKTMETTNEDVSQVWGTWRSHPPQKKWHLRGDLLFSGRGPVVGHRSRIVCIWEQDGHLCQITQSVPPKNRLRNRNPEHGRCLQCPVDMTWRNHVPVGFRHSELNLSFPGMAKNSSPGMSKVGILSDPNQGRKDVRRTVREPYLKGRSDGKSENTLNSWSSHVESKHSNCQFHKMVTGTRGGKKFIWASKSSKTSMNLSGTSGFLPFASFLSWLKENRISSLVQKDRYDRFEVCRPYIHSCSKRGFANDVDIPTELSGYRQIG
jgi:hypothetical protein